MSNLSVNRPITQAQPLASGPKETHLDKMVNTVKANTADGTFIGDNMFLTGAGSLVGLVAAGSGAAKIVDSSPALQKAVEFTFVDNGKLVAGAAAAATSALLAEDAIASYQEGSTGKAIAEGAGAAITGLGAVELVGRQYNIPLAKQALSTPVGEAAKFAYKNAQAIGGTALAAAGVATMKDGLDNLKQGSSMLGGAELVGGGLAVAGGVELVGRQYNIPIAKSLLSTPAEWVGKNIQAVTGATAAAGGTAAIIKGVSDFKEGKKLQGGAIIAGGVVGTLGGAELIGRQYNIPVMKEALTGTAKALFTSKGGVIASGSAIAASGLGAAGDGVRRLTTQTGILNDAIGVAEVTAGVAGMTGGASLIGYATGNAKLQNAFTDNLDILGGTALLGAAGAMGKFTYEDIKENGVEMTNIASGAGAAAAALGGTQIIAEKMGIPVLDKAFTKGAQPIAAVGLGAVAYKLGEVTLNQGSKLRNDLSTKNVLITAGAATGTVLAAAGSVAMAGKALNIPIAERAGMSVLNGVKNGAVAVGETAMDKVIEPAFSAAVKHPGITLGALAVAAGVGYYVYKQNQE